MLKTQLVGALAALPRLVTIGVIFFAPSASAQEDWLMIDEDEIFIEEVSQQIVSQSQLSQSRWTGGLEFLAMSRNDDLDVLWGTNGRSTLESDLNSGLQVELAFRPIASDSGTHDVRRLSFVTIQGSGEERILGDTYASSASLIGGSIQMGMQSPLLRGDSRSLVGLRYLNVADQIDVLNAGTLLAEDWVKAINHIVTLDGTIEGTWYYKKLVFTATLSGGVGFNQATQNGWLAGGGGARYETQDFNFSTTGEFRSSAGLNVTDHIRMHVGVQGLMATGVHQVRGAYGGPGDTDTVRLVGMTFGIEQEF